MTDTQRRNSVEQKLIKSMTGYKATDKDMKCRGYQFELGKWHEIPKDKSLVLCGYGFHFCKYPSGVWVYRSDEGARIFKVEAEEILDAPVEPGADYKLVCYRIRLVEEVKIDGEKNTGYRNTGDRNTGYRNTGDRNTGDRNTGDRNTGNWNIGNFHAGFFCMKPEKVICFDVQTKYTRVQFEAKYHNLLYDLYNVLDGGEAISYSRFKKLPGITKKKLEALHKAHIEGRKKL